MRHEGEKYTRKRSMVMAKYRCRENTMMTDSPLKKLLSHQDSVALLELINRAVSCTDEDAFRRLMDDLRLLVPFDFAISGTAHLGKGGTIDAADIININYPAEWLSLYIAERYHEVDPIILENFGSFAFQYWEDTYRKWNPPKDFVMRASDFGIRRGYTHGMRDVFRGEGSIFSFAGASTEYHNRTRVIIENLVPHFHNALVRVLNKDASFPGILSDKEGEVLGFISWGKTNKDISDILGISENTVKFHIKSIFQKLNAETRAQAVAIAIERGLIKR
jgi:DNA-binding CsgD family transcriptional regulator